ncbi:MAG: glyoxalase/bleomycin resistance protein/dioxygenase [Rhodospirillales bacterium]|jgi:catechol 2,3-dioxygenase-like lactoylglutathione lyase family enzyme|nr:glyoxalase/bleomycin resistance protein/dioxygenase [Rhodospirillales bacterium]
MADAIATDRKRSVLKTKFISHGTLGSCDLEASRKFYEEFLGLEVVRTSRISLFIRLGGDHVYAVVETDKAPQMHRINHNGVDVENDAEVDESWRLCHEQAEKWGLTKITKPAAVHGTYSFHFVDRDGNDWEILSNPAGGYTWIFDQGDLAGKGHMDRNFRLKRPGPGAESD